MSSVSRLTAWTIPNRSSSTNNNGGTRSSSSPCLRLHITRHSIRDHIRSRIVGVPGIALMEAAVLFAAWIILAYLWFVGNFSAVHTWGHGGPSPTRTEDQNTAAKARYASEAATTTQRHNGVTICSCSSWPPAGCQHQPVESSGGWRKRSHRMFACES